MLTSKTLVVRREMVRSSVVAAGREGNMRPGASWSRFFNALMLALAAAHA